MQISSLQFGFLFYCSGGFSQQKWSVIPGKLLTPWTEKVDPNNPLPGYPRPQMQRGNNYPEPLMPDPSLFGARRILVLGEFGGWGLPVENHTWQDKNNWGYQTFKNKDELMKRYTELMDKLPALIEKGSSAASLKALHDKLYESAKPKPAVR